MTPLHIKAQQTDSAWQAELERLFGSAAGDVRYSVTGAGNPGTKLRALYDARMDAQRDWHAELDAKRARGQ